VKRLLHALFGCDRKIDVGHGRMGHVYRCSQCGQPLLVPFKGTASRISEAQAMEYAEYFES
jgi:DNA-directed RNA polymerase subunit RPC12/RpoP